MIDRSAGTELDISSQTKIGRPSKEVVAIAQFAADTFVRELGKRLSKQAGKLAAFYIGRGYRSDRVLCHIVDKLVPDIRPQVAQSAGMLVAFMNLGGAQTVVMPAGVRVRPFDMDDEDPAQPSIPLETPPPAPL